MHEITPELWVATIGTTRTVAAHIGPRYDRRNHLYDQADPGNVYVF